jgi:glutamine amidotransferase
MIAIIQYNAGNIRSVKNALDRLGVPSMVTDDHDIISHADKVIMPGVGEANTAMRYLRQRQMDQLIRNLQQPFLGICLGMQLMGSHSEENDTICLGIVAEKVKRFPPLGKIPHMGWNDFLDTKGPLFRGINDRQDVYYVHSYCMEVGPDTVASTDYLIPFSSAIQRDNFYGVQFHPEKSADVGERILQNFLSL